MFALFSIFFLVSVFRVGCGLRILDVWTVVLSSDSPWTANRRSSFGGFHVFWGQSVRGCCMFCSCYFSVFLCRVLALVFAPEEGGGGSQLKSSVVFPLVVCSVD